MKDTGTEINSENKTNTAFVEPQTSTNHCVVLMEQMPMELEAPAPRWRVAASLTIVDPPFGVEIVADLPFVLLPPLVHKRQIVAVAKYPAVVVTRWDFRFESDDGRALAKVWLHPGTSTPSDCGIFVVDPRDG